MTTRAERTAPPLSAPGVRWSDLALVMVATLGTVAYAMSFKTAGFDAHVRGIAYAIGWAAAVSWLGLGCVLARLTASRNVPLVSWFRACLRTMAIGMAILSCGTALNLVVFATGRAAENSISMHVGILIASDVVMGIVFARYGRTLGIPLLHATLLWILVLNGLFACTVTALWPRL
jgi:hypothetical protein